MGFFGMSCFNEVLRIAAINLNCVANTNIANDAGAYMFSKDRTVATPSRDPASWSVIRKHTCREISFSHFYLDHPIYVIFRLNTTLGMRLMAITSLRMSIKINTGSRCG